MNYRRVLPLLVLTFLSGPSLAADAMIDAKGLEGKWVKEDRTNCDSGAAEYVTFRGNGVMEAGRGAEPKSVGFWGISGNVITIHMLVVPSEDDTSNVFYRGRYSYSYLTAEVLGAADGVIEVITGTTGDTRRLKLAKCP